MALWDDTPVFCFTADVDWASEDIVEYSHESVDGSSLRLTYFNTHPSAFLTKLTVGGDVAMLVHPNFLPDSSQGGNLDEVIAYCEALVPGADGFRTHRYVESNDILDELARRGFKFFSNHCTRCEPRLRPLLHRSGLVSIPIFMEDGGYLLMDPDLDFGHLRPRLDAPGLKVVNFHPAHMAFNTPNFAYTRRIKDALTREQWNAMDAPRLRTVEYAGTGMRSMIRRVIAHARERDYPIVSIRQIYEAYAQEAGSTLA